MPTPAYLSLEGTKQGLITAGTFTEDSVGNIFQEGHEDQILVQAFSHQVIHFARRHNVLHQRKGLRGDAEIGEAGGKARHAQDA